MARRTPRLPTARAATNPVADRETALQYLRQRVGAGYERVLIHPASIARKERVPLPELRSMAATLRQAERAVRTLRQSRLSFWPCNAPKSLAPELDSLASEIEHATSHALAFNFDPLFESDGRLLYAFLAMKSAALVGVDLPSVTLLMTGAVAGGLESGTTDRATRHDQWRKRRRVALALFKDFAADFNFSLTSIEMFDPSGYRAMGEARQILERLASHKWTSEELDHMEDRDRARAERVACRQGKSRAEDGAQASPGGERPRTELAPPVPVATHGPQDAGHGPRRPAPRRPRSRPGSRAGTKT